MIKPLGRVKVDCLLTPLHQQSKHKLYAHRMCIYDKDRKQKNEQRKIRKANEEKNKTNYDDNETNEE